MSSIEMNAVLSELRRLRAVAGGEPSINKTPSETGDFASVFKTMLHGVSDSQMNASHLAKAFEMEDSKVDLAEVMIAQQKARLSFQTTLQVRNKLVAAYQDIMNMPI